MFVGPFSPLHDRNEKVEKRNLSEPMSDREDDDKQGGEANDKDSAASSAEYRYWKRLPAARKAEIKKRTRALG